MVLPSALSTMSISDGLMARSSSGYSPVTVCRKMLSGRRMPSSSANFSAGMILPRAIPAMSGMMASTSEMPWSRRNCLISFAILGRPDYLFLSLILLARRSAELGEQRHRKRVAHHLPFGVPLHRERESRRRFHAKRFDQAIGCSRFDHKPRREPVDTLPVQGVHAHLS